jgi:hypothetical protein
MQVDKLHQDCSASSGVLHVCWLVCMLRCAGLQAAAVVGVASPFAGLRQCAHSKLRSPAEHQHFAY